MRFLFAFLLSLIITTPAFGWDFNKSAIPVDEIISGGPPKDGIPALKNPKYIAGEINTQLRKDDQMIGVFVNGEARAYPLRIMSWHELVNDNIGGLPILVSW